MNATVYNQQGIPRKVKNLRWLLHHADRVRYLVFFYNPGDAGQYSEGVLEAILRDGGKYRVSWASLSVCWAWLNRPKFRGLPFLLVHPHKMLGCRWTVGDSGWEAVQRLTEGQSWIHLTRLCMAGEPYSKMVIDAQTNP